MVIELEDTGPGHKPVKVIATDKDWQVIVGENVLDLRSVGEASAVCRVLDKVLRTMEVLA